MRLGRRIFIFGCWLNWTLQRGEITFTGKEIQWTVPFKGMTEKGFKALVAKIKE